MAQKLSAFFQTIQFYTQHPQGSSQL
ncbi:rCG30614 [Rattus norvegicus]|uniref:RCG30614 n=1 Tax=Rattus norvegicus TaxID=10116 RepID=A6IS22_RAT|nr:rCG30614 [Rattus norvegicus]